MSTPALAAKQRHAPPAAGRADVLWREALLLPKDTCLQHETETSGGAPEVGYASWKAGYLAHAGVPWPEHCAFCNVGPPIVAAHVSSMEHAGLFLVPACSACNSNPAKKLKRQVLQRDVMAQPVPVAELQRVLREQARLVQHAATRPLSCSHSSGCAKPVCAKGDCGGKSVKYCCQHCTCQRKGSKCVARKQLQEYGASEEAKTPPLPPPTKVESKSELPSVKAETPPLSSPTKEERKTELPSVKAETPPPLPAWETTKISLESDWLCVQCELINVAGPTKRCDNCVFWNETVPQVLSTAEEPTLTDVERLTRYLRGLPSVIHYKVAHTTLQGKDVITMEIHLKPE